MYKSTFYLPTYIDVDFATNKTVLMSPVPLKLFNSFCH